MLSGLDGALSLVHNNYAPNTTNTAANFTVAEWKEMLGERLDRARKVWSGLDKSKSFNFEADFSTLLHLIRPANVLLVAFFAFWCVCMA